MAPALLPQVLELADHYRKLHADSEVARAKAELAAAEARQALVYAEMKAKYGMGDADTYDTASLAIRRAAPPAPPALESVP